MTAEIISDREILHRDTSGIRVTREQIIQIGNKRFRAQFWTDLSNLRLQRVESTEILP